ncbi:hypothetical protein EVAR_14977_1 [Eumeta japonica]|uniref:Uncharacterized protein n=1 Tax=Eumeta variegata TaxID=151549 RepID=A0A4C1X9S2_EUMVA|nr:hypothetical protein EVAR_14977_1 [Eumeta japonica]
MESKAGGSKQAHPPAYARAGEVSSVLKRRLLMHQRHRTRGVWGVEGDLRAGRAVEKMRPHVPYISHKIFGKCSEGDVNWYSAHAPSSRPLRAPARAPRWSVVLRAGGLSRECLIGVSPAPDKRAVRRLARCHTRRVCAFIWGCIVRRHEPMYKKQITGRFLFTSHYEVPPDDLCTKQLHVASRPPRQIGCSVTTCASSRPPDRPQYDVFTISEAMLSRLQRQNPVAVFFFWDRVPSSECLPCAYAAQAARFVRVWSVEGPRRRPYAAFDFHALIASANLRSSNAFVEGSSINHVIFFSYFQRRPTSKRHPGPELESTALPGSKSGTALGLDLKVRTTLGLTVKSFNVMTLEHIICPRGRNHRQKDKKALTEQFAPTAARPRSERRAAPAAARGRALALKGYPGCDTRQCSTEHFQHLNSS